MLGFAGNNSFFTRFSGKRRFRCGEKLARSRDGLRRRRFAAESSSICACSGSEVFPGHFFFSSLLLWFCVLHVLRYFVHWNWCVKAVCSTVAQSVQITVEWLCQRFSKGTCSPVLSCNSACVLQVMVGRSHSNCYIMDAIWMSGFARNIVFFPVNGGSVAENSWLAHTAVLGVVALPRNPARFARAVEQRVPGHFFFSSLLLCFCVLHVLRYFVHSNWCAKAVCSTVARCNSLVLCHSVCADRSGMAAPTLLEGYLFSSTVLRI